jgi:spore maturation protein CgeB
MAERRIRTAGKRFETLQLHTGYASLASVSCAAKLLLNDTDRRKAISAINLEHVVCQYIHLQCVLRTTDRET